MRTVVGGLLRHPRRWVLLALALIWLLALPELSADGGWAEISLFLLLTLIIVVLDRLSTQIRALRSDVSAVQSSIGSLWGLLPLQTWVRGSLPALEGSALSLEATHTLARLVATRAPKTIVELGPGASTIALHLSARASRASPKVVGVEQDTGYADTTRQLASEFGIDGYTVLHAPMTDLRLPDHDWQGQWYAPEVVRQLPDDIDLLVVDGPTNYEPGQDNRFPAGPMLVDKLSPTAVILVDDTDRSTEARMVERWCTSLGFTVVSRHRSHAVLERSLQASHPRFRSPPPAGR